MSNPLGIRPLVADMPESQIREVANAGIGQAGVLPFWFGESDIPTAPEVRAAAAASLERGETFYTHNLGLAELRQAIAGYASALHGSIGADRIAVTSSGVSALMIANQLLLEAGDEVIAITPVWPNLVWQPRLLGARLREISLQPGPTGWRLDLDALLATITSSTRLLILASPNNPTGWTLTRAEQQRILDHCRRTGTWILADEVYERLYYAREAAVAPSFLDIADADDRLLVVQSFSKAFLMTGWRLGWLTVPAAVLRQVGVLIEYNTSCAPVFVQRAGLAAIANAASVAPLVEHFRQCRDTLVNALAKVPGVQVVPADGGMYVLLRVEGYDDSLVLAKRLVVEARLGLAPGSAFGTAGEGWLRWCFASRDVARLEEGAARLAGFLRGSTKAA
jgi:aspartate/methionine/tyrosine aminotransferase